MHFLLSADYYSCQIRTSKKAKQIEIYESGMHSYGEESNKEMGDEVPAQSRVCSADESLTSSEKLSWRQKRKEIHELE